MRQWHFLSPPIEPGQIARLEPFTDRQTVVRRVELNSRAKDINVENREGRDSFAPESSGVIDPRSTIRPARPALVARIRAVRNVHSVELSLNKVL